MNEASKWHNVKGGAGKFKIVFGLGTSVYNGDLGTSVYNGNLGTCLYNGDLGTCCYMNFLLGI